MPAVSTLTIATTDGVDRHRYVAHRRHSCRISWPTPSSPTEDTLISFNGFDHWQSRRHALTTFENAGRVAKVTQGAHGSVAFAADGSFTYTPDADYHGPDSFTYTRPMPVAMRSPPPPS
ncbi:MAG: cadherin-like domain-containing protein [Candidatus Accumulibacter sp.]|nr:cadherin-like domain-containing protein [Accumulibacter sp.]